MPRHISMSSVKRPATTGTGCSRRFRPIPGWSSPERRRIAGVRSAPAARTTTGARTVSFRAAPRGPNSPSTPTAAPFCISTRLDARVCHDPRATGRRSSEVCPDPRPLRAATTTERTTAAIGAIGSVPPRRSRLPAERIRATEDDGVLWRDRGRFGDVELRLDRSNIVIPRGAGHAFEAVLRRPFIAHGLRRRDARHPVDQGPASDCGARQHRDRAVPRRQQSTIEVEPVEGIDLGARHRGLVDERSGLEHDDRPAGGGELGCDDPTAGARADDDDVGVQHPAVVVGRIAADGGRCQRPDRRSARA